MSIRGYAALLTGCAFTWISFEGLWEYTRIEFCGVVFLAVLIGIFAVCAFMAITSRRQPRPVREAGFAKDGTGLDILLQRNSRG